MRARAGLAIFAVFMSMAFTVIARWEGKSNTAYLDIVKVPTICFGYTKGVKMGDTKTDEQCEKLLKDEIARISAILDSVVKVPIQVHTKVALTSFMYNVGDGAFIRSTLLKKLNAGDTKGACYALEDWVCITVKPGTGNPVKGSRCYSKNLNKKVSKGLQNRRAFEKALCLGELK